MSGNDSGRELLADRRGLTVNSTHATGTLVALTLVLGVGLGAGVLFAPPDDTGEVPSLNFTFTHYPDSASLLVTLERGAPVAAGNIKLSNAARNVTWATVANVTNDTTLAQGDTIQLSQGSNFGSPVTSSDTVDVWWDSANATRVVATWSADQ
jgi:hypothetical protein